MRELLVVRDIRRYAGQLAEKEAHFRSLVAGATDLTLVLDERLTDPVAVAGRGAAVRAGRLPRWSGGRSAS